MDRRIKTDRMLTPSPPRMVLHDPSMHSFMAVVRIVYLSVFICVRRGRKYMAKQFDNTYRHTKKKNCGRKVP